MTNKDVLIKTLSRVTGKPEMLFRNMINRAILAGKVPTGKLDADCPNGDDLVEYYVTNESSGIMNWLLDGAALANGSSRSN